MYGNYRVSSEMSLSMLIEPQHEMYGNNLSTMGCSNWIDIEPQHEMYGNQEKRIPSTEESG